MLKLQEGNCTRSAIEREVVKALRQEEYTLNTVNCYGENLLHISVASGSFEITKEILQKEDACQIIDRKTKFGWTPLMLAIRNRDFNTVELLLKKNANTNETTYLGMSVLGLAAAINKEMFELVYQACPSALLNAACDDITPLCIAAMKNDKELFFRLLDLGLEVSKTNDYTQIMMKQSIIPEIANLVQDDLDVEDYWNDTSDNIAVENVSDQVDSSKSVEEQNVNDDVQNYCDANNNNSSSKFLGNPTIMFHHVDSSEKNVIMEFSRDLKPQNLKLLTEFINPVEESSISPVLSCGLDKVSPVSPNIFFLQTNSDDITSNRTESTETSKYTSTSAPILRRLQSIRPADLNISSNKDQADLESSKDAANVTLGYAPEFSPIRSPHVPADINDDNVYGEDTPTPPRYKTPPRGMILNSQEAKMFLLLKHYGLGEHAPIFLEQEVDIDLFVTLDEKDLIEIGIDSMSDIQNILEAINDYKNLLYADTM